MQINDKKPLVIVVTGPTASGKTALAIEISKQFQVELINMDSAQVYQEMDIGTAKITKQEQQLYPHHLMDLITPEQVYDTGQFVNDATKLCNQIINKGKIPILVGGTMLYYNALVNGLAKLPSADENIRKELYEIIKQKGHQPLIDELKQIDPKLAGEIQGNNTQRLVRFVEIARITKKAPTQFFAEQEKPNDFDFFHICIIPEREILHKRIEKRMKIMLEQGFLKEVEYLRSKYNLSLESSSMRCVGYRQAFLYQDGFYNENLDNNGNTPEQEMLDRMIFATRQLAKRQITWLKKFEKDVLISDFREFNFDCLKSKISLK